ncbi:MAG: thioredoxin family protein [Sphingomonadaceae bacterium]|nr:thioredoxin family protein [Sphingomonadaceae bacterium]
MKRGLALAGLTFLASPGLTGCAQDQVAPASASHAPRYPAGKLYVPDANAASDLAAASVRAAALDRPLLVIFGANWCHDSRALAETLTLGETGAYVAEHFETLFIDIGTPQIGRGRNLDLVEKLGVEELEGTPALVALSPDGKLLNGDTARSWRNAASRSEKEIRATLEALLRAEETA